MLHTKFRGNWPVSVLEKKIFEGFLPYMGVAAILVSRPKFQCHYPRRLHIKFQLDRPSGFREEDL